MAGRLLSPLRKMRRRGRTVLLALGVVAALLVAGATWSDAATPTPDQVGQWSAPAAWPLVAVHMTMQPDGKILMFDGFAAALNSERVYNPTTQTFTDVPYGRNLFCAGHILLPDGRSLIVGGHVQADQGLADTTLFNDSTNSWVRAPDMSVTRWYPTATQLPDGRVLVFSGDNIITDRPGQVPPFKDAAVNSLPEIYDPVANTWQDLTNSRLTSPLYPYMFVLSDGRILDAGPDLTTRILTPGTWAWSTIGTSPFDGMSAVMYRPDKIMKSGSWADPDFSGANVYNAQARTAVLDMSQANPTWRETAPMALARAYHNLTLLPDGTVLASGGESQSDGVNLAKGVLPAEIWNPDSETWTTVASLTNAREYHSTALLLQDGRVLMAGGGADPSANATESEERRGLLAAVSLQGSTADDDERSRNHQLRSDVLDPHTRRGEHRLRLAHPDAVRDARIRPEPAIHVAELRGERKLIDGDGSGNRRARASGRLPALHPQPERRPVDRRNREADRDARQDRADGLADGAGCERHRVWEDGERHRKRSGQRPCRRRHVRGRRPADRDGIAVGPVQHHVGHDVARERHPQPHRGRSRPDR